LQQKQILRFLLNLQRSKRDNNLLQELRQDWKPRQHPKVPKQMWDWRPQVLQSVLASFWRLGAGP
jgi:hypothetical protein